MPVRYGCTSTTAPFLSSGTTTMADLVARQSARPVTVEFFRVPRHRVPSALGRMATDRLRLARTPGLRFHRLLGTGDGRTFDLRDADLRTWGVLTVWEDAEAAEAYRAHSAVAAGWRRIADEAWRADLRLLASRGRWSGEEPFGTPAPAPAPAPAADPASLPGGGHGPVAALTRARLRPARMATFWRSVPPVNAALRAQDGLRLAIGIGEAPVGLQGTFSVWQSADALTAFAYRGAAHRKVIEATPRENWYREELFARFAVERTTGTIFGSDPCRRPPIR
jgi:heme-degrading monooxygenase HmoA